MREEVSNWFSRWEEELPPPEDLMPLSQTLITRDLALAFDIWNSDHHHHHNPPPLPLPPPPLPPFQTSHTLTTTTTTTNNNNNNNPSSQPNSSAEFDSSELGGTVGGSGGEESARTLKRPRLVWTPQLHKRFVDAVAQLGIKNAVPKTIMQLMSVDGLTRENVASHLQKYRLYLKRMQGNSYGGGGGSNNNSGLGSGVGSDMDHLFASSPVPVQFLHQGRPNSDHHFVPFSPVTPMQHNHHQMAAAAVAVMGHHHHHHQSQLQQQFRHFGNSPPNGGHFEHPYLVGSRQSLAQVQRMGASGLEHSPMMPSYIEDIDSVPPPASAAAAAANGRKILTLFPTRDD